MILTLYDKNNKKRFDISSDNDSCTHQKGIQTDNMLSLTFTLCECIPFNVNDYIDFLGERFWNTEFYIPKQVSTIEWEYNVKLYAIESLIKRFLVVKTVNNDAETEFAYTATAHDHVALIVKSINEGMGTTDWKVGEVVTSEYLVMDYKGTYCDEGLKKLAEETGVEYWIDGTTINLTRCEHGGIIRLGYENGLVSLEPSTADNVKFFTRLYPIGSSRNIVYDDYGHSRLQLPDGVKYLDQDTDKFGVIHHYEAEAFSNIYPRRIGTVTQASSNDVVDKDGNPYTIYYFKDSGLNFNPNDYKLGGKVITITFEDGELRGRDFEVNYLEEAQEFEIITQFPYEDMQMPNDVLKPHLGDKYVMWNLKMPIEYYALAEKEYKSAVDKYIAEQRKDVRVYKAQTDYINIQERGLDLDIGQRVRLENSLYFKNGYRDSRITKITRKICCPTDIELEISDVISKGSLEKVNDSLTKTQHFLESALETLPDVIKSWESTEPTDTNLYSAKKSEKEFLSKYKAGFALELIRFLGGVEVGDAIDSMLAGKGVIIDKNGRMQLSRLEVRDSMTVNELIYNRQQAMEGDFIFSEKGKIESISEAAVNTYKVNIHKEWDFDFTALEIGDIVRGYVNNLESAKKEYYTSWCRVIEKDISANTLTLVMYADSEVPGGKNYPPAERMIINRFGSVNNKERQSVWFLSSYDGMIVRLSGVAKPILEIWNYGSTWGKTPNFVRNMDLPINPEHDYLYARGAIIQDLLRIDYQGKPLMEVVDRGNWSTEDASGDNPYLYEAYNSQTMRYENHEVWHNSIKWKCLRSNTTQIPRWNSSDWEALSGDFVVRIESVGGQKFFRGSNVNTTLTASVLNGTADISTDVQDEQVEWQRISSLRDEDIAWNIQHANNGLALKITPLDLPSDWLDTKQVSFKCIVSIREAEIVGMYNINK